MAKFKVGDRVRVIDDIGTRCKIGDTGTIMKHSHTGIAGDCYAVQMDKREKYLHDCGGYVRNGYGQFLWDSNIKPIEEKPTREFKLIITSKGDTTTAKLIHGERTVVKEATVTRYSKDEYSEKAAVEAVVKKIFGEDEKKEEKPKYFTGKAVWFKDTSRFHTAGRIYVFEDGVYEDDIGLKHRWTCAKEELNTQSGFLPIVE